MIPADPRQPVRMASSVCSSRINTAAVIDEANADIATPHSVTFIGVSRCDRTRRTSAPAKQRGGTGGGNPQATKRQRQPKRARHYHRQRRPGVESQNMRLRRAGCGSRTAAARPPRRARRPHYRGGAEAQQSQFDNDVMVEIARIEMEECLHHGLRGDEACADAQMQNSAQRQQQSVKIGKARECASWLNGALAERHKERLTGQRVLWTYARRHQTPL